MIDLILFKEHEELTEQVSPQKQLECLSRVFARHKVPPRGPSGSIENEERVNEFLKLMVEELRKEVK